MAIAIGMVRAFGAIPPNLRLGPSRSCGHGRPHHPMATEIPSLTQIMLFNVTGRRQPPWRDNYRTNIDNFMAVYLFGIKVDTES